jgi:hypothetical protein
MLKARKSVKCLRLGALFASLGLGLAGMVNAEEVPTGYIVTKANLASVDKQTFDGHNLGSMIPPSMRKMIELGLTLKLAPTKPVIQPPSLIAATEKYSGNVKYDRATRRISGYVAGIPFPNLSDKDPDVAEKAIWNQFYSALQLVDVLQVSTRVYAIDGTKGVERTFDLVNSQLKLTHRYGVEPVAPKFLGDGNIFRKVLIFNLAPQDVAGTGAYIQRYDDGRLDDSWAYIKSIRRIRRMSGGTWMDPIPGTDLLNDDSACIDAFPTWYPKYKFIGKQWVLALVHGTAPGAPGTTIENYLNIKEAPFWNPINENWEPREVFVIDGTPPDAHPYSRKRFYFDIQANGMLMCDLYDKKGQLWRFFPMVYSPTLMADGEPGSGSNFVWITDLQRMHSTYVHSLYHRQNEARANPADWAPEALADSEKFSIPGLTKRFGPTGWNAPWNKR